MKRLSIPLLLLLFIPTRAQPDRLDSLLNDVLGYDNDMYYLYDSTLSFVSLYSGLTYDSKTIYAGRELGDDMYNVNGYFYLFHSKGYFIGAIGSWYSQFDPGYGSTIVSAGIRKDVTKNKKLAFRTAYSRYIYYKPDPEYEYSYNNSLKTGLTLKNNWIGGRLSANLLFGKEVGLSITPVIFSDITLFRFLNYNDLQFEPELSFLISNETIEYENVGNNSRLPDSRTIYTTEDVYGLLNTQLYIPLCLTLGDFDLEVSYTLNIPTTQDSTIKYPVTSYYSLSLGYFLPIFY